MSSEAERPAWIETWARRIETLGLSSVAIPLIEVTHAFGLVGSQVLLIAQPLVTTVINDGTLKRISALLDDPKLLEQLQVRLERKS